MTCKKKWDLTLASVAFSEHGTVAAREFRGKIKKNSISGTLKQAAHMEIEIKSVLINLKILTFPHRENLISKLLILPLKVLCSALNSVSNYKYPTKNLLIHLDYSQVFALST